MNTLNAWMASLANAQPDGWSRTCTIEAATPWRLVCAAELSVTCLSGTAWITTAGDTHDMVLAPGQHHVASRQDRLFINGMPRCVLQFESRVAHEPVPWAGAQGS